MRNRGLDLRARVREIALQLSGEPQRMLLGALDMLDHHDPMTSGIFAHALYDAAESRDAATIEAVAREIARAGRLPLVTKDGAA